MKKMVVTIGLVQMKMAEGPDKNLAHALSLVEKAAEKGAKIICLPELFRTRYFPQRRKGKITPFSETIPGESTRAFAALAKKLRVVIIVPVYERAKDGSLYNAAIVVNERGALLPKYRKVHIPHDPNFYEKDYFREGSHYRVYRTRYADFAVLICYDQWFPEAARAVALEGADIIFYPTAIAHRIHHRKTDGDWKDSWQTVMRGHAIANAVHVAAVNRTGKERQLQFFGSSFIADSFGTVLKRASKSKEELLIARLDLRLNARVERDWMFFKNRRPETYAALTRRAKHS